MLFTFTFLPDSFHYLRPEIAWAGRVDQLSRRRDDIKSQSPGMKRNADGDTKLLAIKIQLLYHWMAQPADQKISSIPLNPSSKTLPAELSTIPANTTRQAESKQEETFSLRNMFKCNMRNGHIHTRHSQPLRAALMRTDESAGLDTCCKEKTNELFLKHSSTFEWCFCFFTWGTTGQLYSIRELGSSKSYLFEIIPVHCEMTFYF